jgi:hypothetical protein
MSRLCATRARPKFRTRIPTYFGNAQPLLLHVFRCHDLYSVREHTARFAPLARASFNFTVRGVFNSHARVPARYIVFLPWHEQ